MNSNANPDPVPPQSRPESKGPNGLGCLLIFLITLGAIILAGSMVMTNTPTYSVYGDNQYLALAGLLAPVALVILVVGAVAGWLSYKLMARLLPKK
jgi:hypothetical protein